MATLIGRPEAHQAGSPVLEVSSLTGRYNGRLALDDISFRLDKGERLKEDTAIGVVFAGMFALGIALISTVRSYTVDLTHFLVGNVLGVSPGDVWLTVIFGGLVILVILAFLFAPSKGVLWGFLHRRRA